MKQPSHSLVKLWREKASLRTRLAAPLSWPWAVGATLHRKCFDLGFLKRERLEVPVVSVGNLVVGGAGKTPVTLSLAERFLKAGRRVAVVSRGYGREDEEKVVVVSDGHAVRATAEEGGDEPVWLARRLPGLIVTVAARRLEAARAALELGADLILLDDGFSHHRLERRDDVLVVDSEWGLGNGLTLPVGPLREPPRAGRRASLVWLTKCRTPDAPLPPVLEGMPLLRSSYEATGLCDLEFLQREPVESLSGMRVVAVSGIARPQSFESVLTGLGASVRAHLAFGDHHRFSDDDIERIGAVARSERVDLVVTTEKDAMRLSGRLPESTSTRALRMDVRLLGDASALDALVRRYAPGWKGEEP